MTKKIYITIILVLTGIFYLSAQEVKLSAPLLSGKEAKLYYFAGAKVDSLVTVVNTSGKAVFNIPKGNYRGMATLILTNAGGIEIVVAEPVVQLECNADVINPETVNFEKSAENKFLKHIFISQSKYLRQQAWLKSGNELFDAGSPVVSAIQPELKKVEEAMTKLNNEISVSKLYAAKYFRLSEYMNRLFDAEQTQNSAEAAIIRKEMEENLDIASLYTSGRLWESVLNFYISLFNQTAGESKQEQYAASTLRTAQRLPAPLFEAYISGCITETERFGWNQAQDKILSQLLASHPNFKASLSPLQRAIGAYLTINDKSMPKLIGLSKADKKYTKTLIVFYDSDCNSCVNEMFRLITVYPQLQEKGIRVVSVAADIDRKRYEEGIRNFPWQDKLCDFKGFEGENFRNYDIIGTPAIFELDENGIVIGRYSKVEEILKTITN